MTSPKKRSRARRRVERTMEEAFEAAASGRLSLADKLSRRAVDEGFVNPRIWRDRGRVARICGDDDEAEQAFRHAIAIAPNYADAFLDLARLQADRGKLRAAERLLRKVVELRPGDAETDAEHTALAARIGPDPEGGAEPVETGEPPAFTARTSRYDWSGIEAELTARGTARVERFLDLEECARLAALADHPGHLATDFARDDPEARARFLLLRTPLPEPVAELRDELYARLAGIANRRQARLDRTERFPRALCDLTARCARARQFRCEVAVLRLEDGGHVVPVAAPRPRVMFPFLVFVLLGPGSTLRHLLRDLRPGRKVRERATELRCGDALIVCGHRRVVEIAGADGLQDVAHGFAPVAGEPRCVLALPFVEGE